MVIDCHRITGVKNSMEHFPVMLNEVIDVISLNDKNIVVDCTFGRGGYSEKILDSNDGVKLVAFDRDLTVMDTVEKFKKKYGDRFIFVNTTFGKIKDALEKIGISKVDAIIADIGVSSPQIDNGERGFSFIKDGVLDMRMGLNNKNAKDVVNNYDVNELSRIIKKYGEEKFSYKIALKIAEEREKQPIETTTQLANIIEKVVYNKGKINPSTRTFQGIRIYVNDELGELENLLNQSEELLNQGGVLAIVSFHSLEDKIVKNYMREKSTSKFNNRHFPMGMEENITYDLPQKKAIVASDEELSINPRSRSAKLRFVVKR